jgi:hypothetical protein
MEGDHLDERSIISYLKSIEARVISLEDKLDDLKGKHSKLSYRFYFLVAMLSTMGHDIKDKLVGLIK